MILYYIRHGDPIYNPDSLTELGHKQAEALAKRFALYGLDEIYCSTSNRAIQTAEPTCRKLGKEMTLVDWANESHAWERFTVALPDGKREWLCVNNESVIKLNSKEVADLGDKWYQHEYFKEYDFSSGVAAVNKDVDNFFETLGYRHDRENKRYEIIRHNDKRVALFAHAGFGMSFLSSLLDVPYSHFSTHFDLGHSSVTAINFDERFGKYAVAKVCQLSNDSHLYKEGILTGYNNGIDI